MIQLSEFFQYSFVLILNGSVWLELAESAVGRVVLLQLLSIHDGAVGVTNLGVMLLWSCGPVPGPQDAQRRVAIIVTKFPVDDFCKLVRLTKAKDTGIFADSIQQTQMWVY